MIYAKRILRVVIVIVFIGYFLKAIIGDIALKHWGKCKKAVLLNETMRLKYQKATLLYLLEVNGRSYKGNSNEENLNKVGNDICVVYLENMPSVNRPLNLFDGNTKCNCEAR